MKSYIIVLKNHEFSEKLARECIVQANKFGLDVQIFDAIWGQDYKEHMSSTGLVPGRVRKNKMSLGHYGNFFSHYYLWQMCVEINEPVIILEHDGYFIRKLPEDILDNFTDALKLDIENPYAADYDKKINDNLSQPLKYFDSVEGIHKKKKCGWYTWGSYGYIIKPSGAKKLISWVKENGFISTDNQIASYILDIYICSPSIVRLHPFYKDRESITNNSTAAKMGMPINE